MGAKSLLIDSNEIVMPSKAVCRVWLTSAEIGAANFSSDQPGVFDLGQDSCFEVKLKGALLVPPQAPWRTALERQMEKLSQINDKGSDVEETEVALQQLHEK